MDNSQLQKEVMNGIWQFDRFEDTNNSSERVINDTFTFVYENNSLLLKLNTVSTTNLKAFDDIYRVLIKWKNFDLYFFPPFGNRWELFVTWEQKRFIMIGDKKVKLFKRIEPAEIAEWNKELLKPDRKLWDYVGINPESID